MEISQQIESTPRNLKGQTAAKRDRIDMQMALTRTKAQELLAQAMAVKAAVAKDQLIALLFNTEPRNEQHCLWIKMKLDAAMQEAALATTKLQGNNYNEHAVCSMHERASALPPAKRAVDITKAKVALNANVVTNSSVLDLTNH